METKRGGWPEWARILAGLGIGALLGIVAERAGAVDSGVKETVGWWVAEVAQPVGSVFLRLIFMVVIPLIFSAIVLGVLELGDVRKLGRVGWHCLAVTLVLTGMSVAIGIGLVNVLQPGKRLGEARRAALVSEYAADARARAEQGTRKAPLGQALLNLIPANPLAEAVKAFESDYRGGGLLAVMVFSLIFGVALGLVEPEKGRALAGVVEGLFGVCLKVVGFAMRLAPVCVGCLGFAITAKVGLGVVETLGYYMAVVVGGLLLQGLVVYSVVLRLGAGRDPVAFFRGAREAVVTAFATSSSNATLPVSLRVAEGPLGLPRRVSRFVLTVGASANQNGTALYEGVTVLFLAQVFGVELGLGQQVQVALMCVLAGVGTAGVPGGSLPLVAGVLASVGVDPASIAVILGVDRVLDMCRTVLNVLGDLVVAAVVGRRAEGGGGFAAGAGDETGA